VSAVKTLIILQRRVKLDQIHKTDVIVVLGAAVRPGGRPSPTLRRRTLHAIRQFEQGFSDFMIFTGGTGRHSPSEAEVMRRLAAEHGIPDDRLILEETAASTLDSAFACARIIREKGWSTAFVVSDRYHLFRSVSLFRRLGIQAYGSAPAEEKSHSIPRKLRYAIVREWIAFPWSLIRLYVRRIHFKVSN